MLSAGNLGGWKPVLEEARARFAAEIGGPILDSRRARAALRFQRAVIERRPMAIAAAVDAVRLARCLT